MATTNIYNKLQDTSIYINLSSQNLHSAIAALKQEAKPLTTLNIKGFWRHKIGTKRQERRQKQMRSTSEARDRDRQKMARWSDRFLSGLARLILRGNGTPNGRYDHFKVHEEPVFYQVTKKKKNI